MTKIFGLIILILAMLSTSSCSHSIKSRKTTTSSMKESMEDKRFFPIDELDVRKNKEAKVNIPALFLSDSQLNNYQTGPSLWRTTFADFVPVAIRPPRLDLFADDLLKWSIENFGKNKFLIYLGDAINMACDVEWERFENIILPKNKKHMWHRGFAMAPGNHDFYFFGNTSGSRFSKRKGLERTWARMCNVNKYPHEVPKYLRSTLMSKDKFIKAYLLTLRKQEKLFPEDFPFGGETLISNKNYCRSFFIKDKKFGPDRIALFKGCEWRSTKGKSFIQKIHWELPDKSSPDTRDAFFSLLVQEVHIPINEDLTVRIFLLDTQDYRKYPGLLGGGPKNIFKKFNPGLTGEIQERQYRVIEDWIKSTKNSKFLTFFVGHHPKNSLTEKTKIYIRQMINLAKNGVYLSAHTHTGWIDKTENIKEVNIGSTTDWPPHVVEFGVNQKEDLTIVNPKVRYLHPITISKSNSCKPVYDATMGEHPYLSYKVVWGTRKKIHELTFDLVLRAYKNMFKRLGVVDRFKNKPEAMELFQEISESLKKENNCRSRGLILGTKYREKCLAKKYYLLNKTIKFDREVFFAREEDRLRRLEYGACQASWASKMEFTINQFWKGPYHTLGLE